VVRIVVECHLDMVYIFKFSRPTHAHPNVVVFSIIESILNYLLP
jgi:hypothetical protein